MAEKTPEQIKQDEVIKSRQEHEKKQQEAEKNRQELQKKNQEELKKQSQQTQNQRSAGGSTGKVSTYSAQTGGVVAGDPRGEDRGLTHDEIKSIAGDLLPGELAFVKLNEEGTPEGAAIRDIPKREEVVARVYASPKAVLDDVVTPSGAPLTKYMNPDPQLWDAGMLERNPIPDDGGRTRDKRIPAGGGVINQPVTT